MANEKNEKKSASWQKYLAIALCAVIGVAANLTTDLQKEWFGRVVIGGPMLALLVTMIICNLVPRISKSFKEGTTFCAKQFLNWGIIATGGTLSFSAILGTGVKALPLIIFNIFLAFAVAILVGRQHLRPGGRRHLHLRRHRHRHPEPHHQGQGGGDCLCHGGHLPL